MGYVPWYAAHEYDQIPMRVEKREEGGRVCAESKRDGSEWACADIFVLLTYRVQKPEGVLSQTALANNSS